MSLSQVPEERLPLILQNIQEAVDVLDTRNASELETTLVSLMPNIVQTMQQIYTKNDLILTSAINNVKELFKLNFQVAIGLIDASKNILECVLRKGTMSFTSIPSVPINIANIIFITFEHCKSGQTTHSCYKSITEVIELFRKTQVLHSRFLYFLNNTLIIDLPNDTDAFAAVLEVILQIGNVVSGVNIKSLTDNWKGFIALAQKHSAECLSATVLSAIVLLMKGISEEFVAILDGDLEKGSIQNVKVTGFLVKVLLKLFEINLNVEEVYNDLLEFWIMIYSWSCHSVSTVGLTTEARNSINETFLLCSESISDSCFHHSNFLKKFCLNVPNIVSVPEPRRSFGFLLFINAVMKELPKFFRNEPQVFTEFSIISLVRLIFDLLRNCYMEYFWDHGFDFYEDVLTNIAVMMLMFPSSFSLVENILLVAVIEDNVWVSIIATDVWYLVLRHSTGNVCQSSLNMLLGKLKELPKGFQQNPVTVRLKFLCRRMFASLPETVKNKQIEQYNPSSHLSDWSILNLKIIPLSHRYYVEFLVCDISDKMDIFDNEDSPLEEMLLLLERLDTISQVDFNELEINASKLVPVVMRMWSLDVLEVSADNMFSKRFIYTLIKTTVALTRELNEKQLLLVLTQLKVLSNELIYKILLCDLLQAMAKRNLNNAPESHALFILISVVLQILLSTKNALAVQRSMEAFVAISASKNYEVVVQKISSSSVKNLIMNFTKRDAADAQYSPEYFQKIQKFRYRHTCREVSTTIEPAFKKFKTDCHVEDIISNLKIQTDKLFDRKENSCLNEKQRTELKSVVCRLELLLN